MSDSIFWFWNWPMISKWMTHIKCLNEFLQQKYFTEDFDFLWSYCLDVFKTAHHFATPTHFKSFNLNWLLKANFIFYFSGLKRHLGILKRTQAFLRAWESDLSFTYSSAINTLCDLKLVTSPLWVLVPSIKLENLSQWALRFYESG